MKEQRKQILAAEAVEAKLGEVEGARSRFVDAGFINTGGRNVDYAGKFLNAVKAGIGAYQSTSEYKQQERDHKTNALADAKMHLDNVGQRAEGVHTADLDAFYMEEMKNAIGSLDDDAEGPLAEIYKSTFSNAVTEKYMSLATSNQVLMSKEKREIDKQNALTNIIDWGYSNEETLDNLTHNGFTNSQANAVWSEGKLGQINVETAAFENNWTLYEEAMSQKENEILQRIKDSGKTRNEWLNSKSADPEVAEAFPEKRITLREIVESELEQEGMEHPVALLDALHQEALNQEGSDGVGKLSELNTKEGRGLFKGVKESREKVAGVKNIIGIKHLVSTGSASIESLLEAKKTGNASVDELTKKKIMSHVIQQSSTWLATIFSNTQSEGADPIAAREASIKLDRVLRMNPDLAPQIIGNQANAYNAQFRQILESGDPTALNTFLYEAQLNLYDANVGQGVRDAIEKAAPGFADAVLLSRINIATHHIQQLTSNELEKPTKQQLTDSPLAETALADRLQLAKKHMPWASPTELIKVAEMAVKFDYYSVGFDDKSFFDLHGKKMSTVALSPPSDMEAGEKTVVDALFGNLFGGTRVPTSGGWKLLAAKDAKNPGYTQGMLHYILSNTNPALKELMVDKLGMVTTEHKYVQSDKTYNKLNFGEGWSDDFQPIRIRRLGNNEWALEVTTREYLDNVPLIGDDQPWFGFTLSNNELRNFSGDFDKHLDNISTGKDKAIKHREKTRKETAQTPYAKALKAQSEQSMIGALKEWWTKEFVVEDDKSEFIEE